MSIANATIMINKYNKLKTVQNATLFKSYFVNRALWPHKLAHWTWHPSLSSPKARSLNLKSEQYSTLSKTWHIPLGLES